MITEQPLASVKVYPPLAFSSCLRTALSPQLKVGKPLIPNLSMRLKAFESGYLTFSPVIFPGMHLNLKWVVNLSPVFYY